MGNGLHTHAPSLPMHPQQPLRLDEHTIPDTLGAAVIQFPASEESLGSPNGIRAWCWMSTVIKPLPKSGIVIQLDFPKAVNRQLRRVRRIN